MHYAALKKLLSSLKIDFKVFFLSWPWKPYLESVRSSWTRVTRNYHSESSLTKTELNLKSRENIHDLNWAIVSKSSTWIWGPRRIVPTGSLKIRSCGFHDLRIFQRSLLRSLFCLKNSKTLNSDVSGIIIIGTISWYMPSHRWSLLPNIFFKFKSMDNLGHSRCQWRVILFWRWDIETPFILTVKLNPLVLSTLTRDCPV